MLPQLEDEAIEALLVRLNEGASADRVLVLDDARRGAIRDYQHIHACPGAGKTTVIALKLMLLAQKWSASHQGVCVLTHTNIAKDEILSRIKRDASGRRLLSYPHFIGTIQDFTHTFLALPACRSKGYPAQRIDDASTDAFLFRKLPVGTRTFLLNKHASVSDLRVVFENGALTIKVPGNPGAHTHSYNFMMAAKKAAIENGFFFFSEMFALAEDLMVSNPAVAAALRHRFPIVMIDEMQDTQKYQDEFLGRLFSNSDDVKFQKVGDPDQAIFDGMPGDQPNESFNGAAVVLQPIPDSGRFTQAIASKVRGLSTRRIALTGSRAALPDSPICTVIVYDDATIGDVLAKFGEIVEGLPAEHRRTIKVVGGISQNAEGANNPLNIQSYWPAFDRSRGHRAPLPSTFCGALRLCVELQDGPVHSHYHLLKQSAVELLRLGGKTLVGRNGKAGAISLANLSRYFAGTNEGENFNRLMAEMMMTDRLSPEHWGSLATKLGECCEVDIASAEVAPFMAFSDVPAELQDAAALPGNVYAAPNGIIMEVSTIHGVKGETHDATLVLETKLNKLFDVAEMLPFLIDDGLQRPAFDPAHPKTNASLRAGFMKKLYVATSRARHLICLAVHRDRISAAHRDALQGVKGWAIVTLAV
ncbi:UvrD-helicase domain-containing protein [Mesorhizobium sp. WSM2239]|uniref:DNA 3'-5' helicase II n=2 Tax=unclassified Mesorhizobium TaxID=325217 RepID=A0AAU8D741_9HYPH